MSVIFWIRPTTAPLRKIDYPFNRQQRKKRNEKDSSELDNFSRKENWSLNELQKNRDWYQLMGLKTEYPVHKSWVFTHGHGHDDIRSKMKQLKDLDRVKSVMTKWFQIDVILEIWISFITYAIWEEMKNFARAYVHE